MRKSEAAQLLRMCTHFDNRDTTPEAAEAWAAAFTAAGGEIPMDDAMAVIVAYYAEATAWLMPAEIIRRVKVLRRTRLERAGLPDVPSGLDQIQERRWAQAWRKLVAAGESREEATHRVDQAAGIVRELESPRPVAQLIAGSKIGRAS